jgi:uncharacterized protein (DUF952 family)
LDSLSNAVGSRSWSAVVCEQVRSVHTLADMSAGSVFRLMPRAAWATAEAAGPAGRLPWNDDDRRDGYFHLSTRDQVAETARRYYADVADLWVVELDAGALAGGLRWEPSRAGELFPHYYGEAPLAAVTAARALDPRDFA